MNFSDFKRFFPVLYLFNFISIFIFSSQAQAADIQAQLDSNNGSSGFSVQDSSSNEVGRVDSNGNLTTHGNVGVGTSNVFIRFERRDHQPISSVFERWDHSRMGPPIIFLPAHLHFPMPRMRQYFLTAMWVSGTSTPRTSTGCFHQHVSRTQRHLFIARRRRICAK